MNSARWLLLLGVAVAVLSTAAAQTSLQPDLGSVAAEKGWKLINRAAEVIDRDGHKAVRLTGDDGTGYARLEGVTLGDGMIEFDVRGRNITQQSFVGIAFHGTRIDTYDAVYFRPFNFKAADPARRARAVQYISHPTFTWQKLRAEHPGEYEQPVDPAPDPDGWFHVSVVIADAKVSVFVNGSTKPSLVVDQIGKPRRGWIALWTDVKGGDFANLRVTPTDAAATSGPPAASDRTAIWTRLPDLPTARYGAHAAAADGLIYVVGGQRQFGEKARAEELATVEAFDPGGNRWLSRRAGPTGLEGLAAVRNRVFGFGKGVTFEYDVSADTWIAKTPPPLARTGYGVTATQDRIYLVGGMVDDGGRKWGWNNTAAVEAYDPETNTWTTLRPMFTPRHQVAVAALAGRIYAIGGAATWANDTDADIDRVETYDIASDRWYVGPRLPEPCSYFAAVALDGKIVTCAGSNRRERPGELTPSTNTWRTLPGSRSPRWQFAVAELDGRIYCIGGIPPGPWAGAATDALALTEVFDPRLAGAD